MILVIGATGTNGKEVVRRLAKSGVPVRALVRDPSRAKELQVPGVELAAGDLDDKGALAKAFVGIERAFVLTAVDPRNVAWVRNVVEAAKASGVRHLVKFSALGARTDSPSELMRLHGESDHLVMESGVPFTILQPNSFYQNLFWSAASIKSEGIIYAALKDARQSSVDVRDIADVAVTVLATDRYKGKALEITGPESLSQSDLAAAISKVLGKTIKHVDIPAEAAESAMLQSGMPAWNARAVSELYAYFATGATALTTDTVATVLGRPPIRFDQFAREHADMFRS
jgi:uncharacterized protein YbjT (DUF2867 family)